MAGCLPEGMSNTGRSISTITFQALMFQSKKPVDSLPQLHLQQFCAVIPAGDKTIDLEFPL